MVALTKTGRDHWSELCRARFTQMLPEIRREANTALHTVPEHRREVLVDEVVQWAFKTFLLLAKRGKIQVAYAKPLAMVAMKQLHARRGRLKPR